MAKEVVVNESNTVVDVEFPVRGRRLASDHGYSLYAALSGALPALHGASWLGVHPIRGDRRVDGAITLKRGSRLSLRVPADKIGELVPLTGAHLHVGPDELWLASPTIRPLVPAPSLDAKVVVVKVTTAPRAAGGALDKGRLESLVRAELMRQLERIGARADLAFMGRRELRVAGRRVVGFSVRLRGMDEASSLAVQREGLGGKRRMGCGVFAPTVGA